MTTEPTRDTMSLADRLANIARQIDSIPRDGHNPHQKYRYPRPETVYRAVKQHLADAGIALVPSIDAIERQPGQTNSGNPNMTSIVTMNMQLILGATGETMNIKWTGEATDTADKSIAKAQTVCMRTFLMHLFQIPSGEIEDPDTSGGGDDHSSASSAPSHNGTSRKPPKPAAPTPDQVKARIFAKHADVLSGTEWSDIVRYMEYSGDHAIEPQSVEDWNIVDGDIAARKAEQAIAN